MHADKDFRARKMSQPMPEEVLFQILQEQERHWPKVIFSFLKIIFFFSFILLDNQGDTDFPFKVIMAL